MARTAARPFMRIANLRREYNLTGLRRSDLESDPIAQFKTWLDQAVGVRRSGRIRRFFIRLYKLVFMAGVSQVTEVNAATLATADKDGRPSARVVLLKGVDERGFVFFTNYKSRKGRDLADNPHAALVFYWPDQERQVCIAGEVKKISREESEAYFKIRPHGSRLAAWASCQSEAAESRSILERHLNELELKFPGDDVPMPPDWGGYVLSPSRIEFWQGRPSRLHDRFCYLRIPDKSWRLNRLYP
jgi:pyridoxamine 5'-phosphate oxidase